MATPEKGKAVRRRRHCTITNKTIACVILIKSKFKPIRYKIYLFYVGLIVFFDFRKEKSKQSSKLDTEAFGASRHGVFTHIRLSFATQILFKLV